MSSVPSWVAASTTALLGVLLLTALPAAAQAAPASAASAVTAVTAVPPGPSSAPEWWFDTWNVQSLWADGARGQGITIAEIDTGVNAKLPELAANVIPGKDFGDPAEDGRVDHYINPFGHGTAMASLMVAHPGLAGITGLAPDARLLPIAVPLSGTDDAAAGTPSDHINDAIRYAADAHAQVISLSLGGSHSPNQGGSPCPQAEQDAITYAIEKGSIVVAAGGNDGQAGSPVEDPAVCLGVVSVGAVDVDDNVAPFSSRHSFLTVTAPGVQIATLGRIAGQAYQNSGTSHATAITSAALALIWSKFPHDTGRQIVTRMLATLDHASTVRDPGYGFGIINPAKAIDTAVASTAPNPVYTALDPFIARQNAAAAVPALPRVAPAATSPIPSTAALVDDPPSDPTTRVFIALLVAIGAVIAFLVLIIVGMVKRRRRRSPDPAPGIPYAALAYPAAPVGRDGQPEPAAGPSDAGNVVWHDVTDIEPSDPFKRSKVSKP
jgi:subtilisin family serine protease